MVYLEEMVTGCSLYGLIWELLPRISYPGNIAFRVTMNSILMLNNEAPWFKYFASVVA